VYSETFALYDKLNKNDWINSVNYVTHRSVEISSISFGNVPASFIFIVTQSTGEQCKNIKFYTVSRRYVLRITTSAYIH
jgi:hypothetical protein